MCRHITGHDHVCALCFAGSSSIATVCGGSLALFDAGVPLLRTVGGVACGLIARCGSGDKRGDVTEHRVMTDLLVRSDCTRSCSHLQRRIHTVIVM